MTLFKKLTLVLLLLLTMCFSAMARPEAKKVYTKTYVQNNTTVDVHFLKHTDFVQKIYISVRVFDIRGKLVWQEIYIYAPKENINLSESDIKPIIEKLLSSPVLDKEEFSKFIILIRSEVLFEDVLPAATVEEPEPRSPDGT